MRPAGLEAEGLWSDALGVRGLRVWESLAYGQREAEASPEATVEDSGILYVRGPLCN